MIQSSRVYTTEDLKSAGLKMNKSYDLTGLPGATGAVLMFYKQKDIEVRFYPSHDTAVAIGIKVAHEIVGPDAVISGGSMTWDKAVGDERACAPGNLGGGRDCTRQPKYGDFVTYANIIIFCEGRNIETSDALCEEIVGLLPK